MVRTNAGSSLSVYGEQYETLVRCDISKLLVFYVIYLAINVDDGIFSNRFVAVLIKRRSKGLSHARIGWSDYLRDV